MNTKLYRISEIVYWVIAVLSTFKAFKDWNSDRSMAYIFVGFAVVSVFMALFRRRFRKKFENRKNEEGK
ncbi:hypothetical protein ACFQ1M_15865 [Sungkyunkwania multivorans]|uniref:Uncharacterized protein n=1 Tax=Sungkyunkwania multivorans TaxID=1173618 RepID=A0ABW3D0W9_9FLAO